MERGKHKIELLRELGAATHNGRTYKVVRERFTKIETGEANEYVCVKLYGEKNNFIKRFAIDPELVKDIGQLLNWANTSILDAIIEAENKAWEALARYKFQMFGYWASIWVHLNRLSGGKRTNPWKKLVGVAKKQVGTIKLAKRLHPAFLDEEDES